MNRLVSAILLGAASVARVYGEEPAALDGMAVYGNRELPKALFIVPWKAPIPGNLDAKPLASLLDEVLAPVDREVFEREVDYYYAYHGVE